MINIARFSISLFMFSDDAQPGTDNLKGFIHTKNFYVSAFLYVDACDLVPVPAPFHDEGVALCFICKIR